MCIKKLELNKGAMTYRGLERKGGKHIEGEP